MRHRYECPVRWADMDQLRHVNNVTYADYLQEARIAFFRALTLPVGGPDGSSATAGPGADEVTEQTEEAYGIVVVRHELTYLAPLHFDFEPVSIESWILEVRAASFTVGYEIFRDLEDGTRRVFLRATTRLAPFVFGSSRPRRLTDLERAAMAPYVEPPDSDPADGPARPSRAAAPRRTDAGFYPVTVRFSDLDPYGHVNNVTYLEYFQEARIVVNGRLWRELPTGTPRTGLVVAQADVDYLRPLVGRAEGYELWTWVERVGNRSTVMCSEIRDGDTVMSRAAVVLVFFDREAGRSTEPPEAYLETLQRALTTPDDPGAADRVRAGASTPTS